MILTDAQKKIIRDNVYKIDKMCFHDLQEFGQQLSLSEPNFDRIVYKWIEKACTIKMAEIMERTDMRPLVVCAEIDLD